FKGLPHRVEFVASRHGVDYYDDSKGTNVGATEAALRGMTRPVVLIAGGDGKGQDFSPLLPACERICRAVLLIGRDGPQIAEVLAEATSTYIADDGDGENFLPVLELPTLDMAVQMAANLAEAGDVVLLSPACASLDMFRNYHHRAEVFIAAVKALPA
ncbi:MAG TPA: cyanophycin synthetase, partial [Chitinolyticbacter sp.]|nr:cyanophycin synthetase [Chitinolyticbacter sp.]